MNHQVECQTTFISLSFHPSLVQCHAMGKPEKKAKIHSNPLLQCQLNKIPNLLPFQRDLQKNLWKLPNDTTSEILRKQTKTNTMQTGSSFHIINQNILTMNQFLSQCVCVLFAPSLISLFRCPFLFRLCFKQFLIETTCEHTAQHTKYKNTQKCISYIWALIWMRACECAIVCAAVVVIIHPCVICDSSFISKQKNS